MAIETIKFSQMTAGGDLSNNDKTPGLLSSENVLFNNPWTFLSPGSTADRPTPSSSINYRLRFNTDTQIYEYYDALISMWVQLSGSGTGTVNPGVANELGYYASNGTIISGLTTQSFSLLATNSSGIPSFVTTLPIGLTLPNATITNSIAQLTAGSVVASPVNLTDLANKQYVDSVSGVNSATGTINQILINNTVATPQTGSLVFTLPQDIASTSSPTFLSPIFTSPILGTPQSGILTNCTALPLTTGIVGNLPVTNLNSGTGATSSTFWRGDGQWVAPTIGSESVQGTQFQVLVNGTFGTPETGAVILSTPQDIDSTSSPTFVSPIFTSPLLGTPTSGVLTNCTGLIPSSGLAATGTPSGTTFLRGDNTWTTPSATVESITGTQHQVLANGTFGIPETGSVTLTIPQNIDTTSSPTFAAVTLNSPLSVSSGGTGFTSFGTGVATALQVNVSTAGSFVVNGGSLGTPSSGNLTNCTGLSLSGVSGLGTGVATALAINVGSSGAFVTFNGAAGTPSSMVGTNITGTASGLTAGSANSVPVGGITGLGTGVGTALTSAVSGSGGMALTTSPTFVTPTLGDASATSMSFSSTSGIIGTTTNNNASAGSVGEFMSQQVTSGSPVTITSTVTSNVASLSLTAGNWIVYGNVGATSSLSMSSFNAWLSLTSATPPDTSLITELTGLSGSVNGIPVPILRVSVASTTTVYLSTNCTFTGTGSAYGQIQAIRPR